MSTQEEPAIAADLHEPRAFTPERMNALTEGVFAIVLTLLVLELRLPESGESILRLMHEDAQVFLAWLISPGPPSSSLPTSACCR